MRVNFTSVDTNPFEHEDRGPHFEDFCACKEPDVSLGISEGSPEWGCEACGKPMSDWFTENVQMAPVKVSFAIEPGYCTCNMMDQLSCDCGQWPVVKPVFEGEG